MPNNIKYWNNSILLNELIIFLSVPKSKIKFYDENYTGYSNLQNCLNTQS